MKIVLLSVLAALALLAGCSSAPTTTSSTQADTEYLYGTWAGTPQRPTLMD